MLQVRVRKLPSEDIYKVEYRVGPRLLIWIHEWEKYDIYRDLPKALSVANELMNPTIINIEKEES
jgi:hypothetical protein